MIERRKERRRKGRKEREKEKERKGRKERGRKEGVSQAHEEWKKYISGIEIIKYRGPM